MTSAPKLSLASQLRERGGPSAAAVLAHPLAISAALLLLLNDFVWQRAWPSWGTGKLSDAAWLVLAPLLGAALLSALRPGRLSGRGFALLAALPVGTAYALAKAVPPVNAALLALGANLGLALKLRLDPSDLLALPALALAAWAWRHAPRAPGRGLRTAALALAAVALLADSAPPIDYGINCLARDAAGLLAVREQYISKKSPLGGDPSLYTVYRSADGGLTWAPDATVDAHKLNCLTNDAWPIPDPANPNAQLYYVAGRGIYHSADQGQTLQLEQAFKNLAAAQVDAASGHLIVAAGTDGIWVKSAAGWQQALDLKKP